MTTLRMFRGDDRVFNLAFTKDGLAQNITGWSIWVTAKRALDDLDVNAVFQKTLGDGLAVVSAVGGTATLTVAAADTNDFEDDRVELFCDIQVKDGAGGVLTPLYFKLIVDPEVTRDTS